MFQINHVGDTAAAVAGPFAATAVAIGPYHVSSDDAPVFMPEESSSIPTVAKSVWAESKEVLSKQLPHYHVCTLLVLLGWPKEHTKFIFAHLSFS